MSKIGVGRKVVSGYTLSDVEEQTQAAYPISSGYSASLSSSNLIPEASSERSVLMYRVMVVEMLECRRS